jgi:hypothetical protein
MACYRDSFTLLKTIILPHKYYILVALNFDNIVFRDAPASARKKMVVPGSFDILAPVYRATVIPPPPVHVFAMLLLLTAGNC